MKKNTRSLLKLLNLTLVIMFLCSCAPPPKPPMVKKDSINQHGDVVIKGGCIREWSKDKAYEVVITAEQSDFLSTSNTLSCQQVACQIMHKTRPIGSIKAQSALVDRKHKELLFNCPISGSLEDILFCGKNIVFNFESGTITTHHQMDYSHPHGHFTAGSSTVDIQHSLIEMDNGVRAEFSSKLLSDSSTRNNGLQ